MENNKNNLELITQIALELLDLPIKEEDIDMLGFVHHPFFNTAFIPYKNELIDIRKDTSKFKEYVKELKVHIKNEDSVSKIMFYINQPYQMFFFSLIKDYLDEQTFTTLLKDCYTKTEFPNQDVNVSVEKIRAMFKKADKNLLMEEDEIDYFNNLDNEIIVYRGFYSDKYYNALSWTLDKETAHFFATRFSDEGSIYQANIKKEDVYAYWGLRNEKELIVNYDKLYNISKIEQFN